MDDDFDLDTSMPQEFAEQTEIPQEFTEPQSDDVSSILDTGDESIVDQGDEITEQTEIPQEFIEQTEMPQEFAEPQNDEVSSILDTGDERIVYPGDEITEQTEMPQELTDSQIDEVIISQTELMQEQIDLLPELPQDVSEQTEIPQELTDLQNDEVSSILDTGDERIVYPGDEITEQTEMPQELTDSQIDEVIISQTELMQEQIDLLPELPQDVSEQTEIPQDVTELQNDEVSSILDTADEPVGGTIDTKTPREYDNFESIVIEKNPEYYESGKFFEQGINENGFEGTCGPTSQANAINVLLGTNELTENKVLGIAINNDLCCTDLAPIDCGGTTTEQFMDLYDKVNEQIGDKVNTELFEFDDALSINQMAQKLEEGSILNVAVDANALWDQPRDNSMGVPTDDFPTDHWITVTGVQKDETGNILGFDIVDSGGGVNYVDKDKLDRICFGTDEHQLMDPTCIVVSKKEQNLENIGQVEKIERKPNVFERAFGKRSDNL